MKMGQYVLALDQGTTSSRAIVFDSFGAIVGKGQEEFPQIYPQPGYVEHDPVTILASQLRAMREAVQDAKVDLQDIAAIGITNQRETTLAWDSKTGLPVCNAIVWQCRRTAPICEELRQKGYEPMIREKTGLILDAYFAGTKMKWILDHVPAARELADKGRLRFGTVDTWLIYSLTEGKSYVTDVTNASRTLLFNIHTLSWDEELLSMLQIPRSALPEVVPSSGIVGTCSESVLGRAIPIAGIAGDQHAALFGQCCFEKGMTKNTYGTGCFVLMNTGETPITSQHGLLSTIAWQIGDKTTYALEGSAFNAGSAINWLRDELHMIQKPSEADRMAESVDDNGGVYFVPAFTGLGAPYWDMYARGAFFGMTRGTTNAHLARAVLESIDLESCDLFHAMEEDAGVKIPQLRVDGGASKSRFLMQTQADLLNRTVCLPVCLETTALGAAMMAGLAVGVWDSLEELAGLWRSKKTYEPEQDDGYRTYMLKKWHKAVERCRAWEEEDKEES